MTASISFYIYRHLSPVSGESGDIYARIQHILCNTSTQGSSLDLDVRVRVLCEYALSTCVTVSRPDNVIWDDLGCSVVSTSHAKLHPPRGAATVLPFGITNFVHARNYIPSSRFFPSLLSGYTLYSLLETSVSPPTFSTPIWTRPLAGLMSRAVYEVRGNRCLYVWKR